MINKKKHESHRRCFLKEGCGGYKFIYFNKEKKAIILIVLDFFPLYLIYFFFAIRQNQYSPTNLKKREGKVGGDMERPKRRRKKIPK